jgi:dihydropteroate synthase
MTHAPAHWAGLSLDRPLVMGILNVTPNSFSDGGKHATTDAAIKAGRAMLAAGVDIIDVGGESTRPNAALVTPVQEIGRVQPVIEVLAQEGAVISADTRHAATMEAALAAGARIINDVSGLKHDPRAATLVAQAGCPVVLMHMRGTPQTMDAQTHYINLLEDVLSELTATRNAAIEAGIRAENIALDPGFGFAKRTPQNLSLLRATSRFVALGHPVLIGVSRKRFIGEVSGETDAAKRFPGSLAAGLYAISQGANLLRVHDVVETVQALRVWERLVAIDDDPDP